MARQKFSSTSRPGGSVNGTPSSMSRSACATEATISDPSASASAAVVCASQMRTSTVPKDRCGRIDHHTCVYSWIESVRMRSSMYSRKACHDPNASGMPQRGKLLVKACERAECRPLSRASRYGRVGADAEQQRQDGAQAVAGADRAIGVVRADVDVQRERVVAPRDVLQALDHAPVVLGVDVALLAVVGPRVGAGRAQRDPARLGQREEAVADVALAAQRVVDVLAAARADLDLAGDQLAGDRLGQHRIVGGGEVAQLLEARHEVERRGVEDRELLLEADGGVGRGGEELLRCGQVDAHGLRSGRSRARRGGPRPGWTCGR